MSAHSVIGRVRLTRRPHRDGVTAAATAHRTGNRLWMRCRKQISRISEQPDNGGARGSPIHAVVGSVMSHVDFPVDAVLSVVATLKTVIRLKSARRERRFRRNGRRVELLALATYRVLPSPRTVLRMSSSARSPNGTSIAFARLMRRNVQASRSPPSSSPLAIRSTPFCSVARVAVHDCRPRR